MANTMECLELREWGGRLHLTEREVPQPGHDEVLIDVEATSVGLTVRNAIEGNLSGNGKLPLVPGHELAGVVIETGDGVNHLSIGDRVAAYFYLICEACSYCHAGRHPLCENHRGYVGVTIDGGYSEYVCLPSGNAMSIPNDVDSVAATTIPDAVGTPYHVAKERARITPGDDVLILGAGGGVGIHLLQVARRFSGNVTAVDINDDKLDRCESLGAEHTINTAKESLSQVTDERELTFDSVIDFTGDMDLVTDALDQLAPQGRLVNLTAFPGRTFQVSPQQLVRTEIEVVGSRYCSKAEFDAAADLVASGAIEPVVTETTDLDGVEALINRIAAGDHIGRGAVVP